MEAETKAATAAATAEERDPRFVAAREEGRGEKGREMLAHAAQGAELDAAEEKSALDWLLGPPAQTVHDIPVDFETPDGMSKLTFVVGRVDVRQIDKIENRNIQQSTGRIDRITCDMEITAEFTKALVDSSGREVQLISPEFLTVKARRPGTGEIEDVQLASPALALERRFVGQEGLITFVAAEIRRVAGYDPQRVGTAQRRLVEASLG